MQALARNQAKSRDKLVNHSSVVNSWLARLVSLLFVYVIDPYFLLKFYYLLTAMTYNQIRYFRVNYLADSLKTGHTIITV